MNLDFEQALGKFGGKVEELNTKAITHLSCSLIFSGLLVLHPRKTLQVLTTEGVEGIIKGYITFQRSTYQDLFGH